MRLPFLIILTLMAFAANSILVRVALASGAISPAAFGTIRLGSGAAILLALVVFTGQRRHLLASGSLKASAALLVYVVGFSFAYLWLDTGTGALILFGGVQITMFAGALRAGEPVTVNRWAGAGMALFGLALLFGPSAGRPDTLGALTMMAAAIGWGIYSLLGRAVKAPLPAAASTFLLATPFAGLIWLFKADSEMLHPFGIVLAVLSGALASGLGYALWYSILPRIRASSAAILQLSVPLLALAGGYVFLHEPLTWSFGLSAPLIMAGVLVALRR